MKSYRLTADRHVRFDEKGQVIILRKGDIFKATEAELKAFRDRLEPVEVEESLPGDDLSTSGEEKQDETPDQNATIDSGNEPDAGEGSEQAPDGKNDPETSLDHLMKPEILKALEAAGIHSMDVLAKELANDPDLTRVKGITKTKAKQIREAVLAMQAKETSTEEA
jgi:hypothetical protein